MFCEILAKLALRFYASQVKKSYEAKGAKGHVVTAVYWVPEKSEPVDTRTLN